MTVAELRSAVRAVVDGPREADWIIGSVLHAPRSALIADGQRAVSATAARRALSRARRRADGQPLQYVTTEAEFCGLPLRVTPDVLIPRPETEELAARVIELVDADDARVVWDVCCGSGAIALAVKRARPHVSVVGFDVSSPALSNAVVNGARLGLPAKWVKADVLADVLTDVLTDVLDPAFADVAADVSKRYGECDIIVSNPPYIGADETTDVAPDVLAFEPAEALFTPDADPLIFYRTIIALAPTVTTRGGRVIFEAHSDRAQRVGDLLREAGFRDVHVRNDDSGRPRTAEGSR